MKLLGFDGEEGLRVDLCLERRKEARQLARVLNKLLDSHIYRKKIRNRKLCY